jgi:hypothetical protein
VEESRRFIWVYVDRDVTPEIPKRFSVSAYPTLLTLSPDGKKIHRFAGYREKAPLLELFADALRRHELYKQGKEWDTPAPRPERICETGTLTALPAPSDAVSGGMSAFGDDLFLVQQGVLRRLDRKTGEVKAEFGVPGSVIDLTTDGKVLYAVESGWTAGRPIHVLDPESGKVLRTIVTAANAKNRSHGAKGIAWDGETLWVLEGMSGHLNAVDLETGEVKRRISTGATWVSGLAYDGNRFVMGGRDAIVFADKRTGAVTSKTPSNYWIRTVEAADGALYLMEQPIFDFDKDHKRIQLWPQETVVHVLREGVTTPDAK